MAILNTIFQKPNSDNLVKSLGNMIVSGVENEGSRKLYFNIISTLLMAKQTIVIANGGLSAEQYSGLQRLVNPHMVGRRAYNFSYATGADSFDALAAFATAEEKAEFIVALLAMVFDLPEVLKNKAQRFYFYAMSTLDELGRAYKLSDVAVMDVDCVCDLVNIAPLPTAEKNRRLRFLSDTSMYSSYLDIETCIVKLEGYKLIDILSGADTISTVLAGGNVIMLNGFLSDDYKKKELLFNALFYILSKCLESTCGRRTINLVLKDADFVCADYVETILEYNESYSFATYVFVDDVSRYIAKNGNAMLDLIKSAVIFNQGSDENANFWSAYFGSRDVQERSHSYTKRKSLNPFATMWDNGGVISSPRKYNSSTQSLQKVNKPIYRPEVFRELRPDEAMCYLREPLMRRKTRIEG